MRTALPAPAFLRDAREHRRQRGPEECDLCSPRRPQIPYHFTVDRQGHVSAEDAKRDPNAFAEYVTRTSPAPPSAHKSWQRHLARAQGKDRLILAPVGTGMSGQLTRWLGPAKAFALRAAIERGERVAVISHKPTGELVGVPLERLVVDDLVPPTMDLTHETEVRASPAADRS